MKIVFFLGQKFLNKKSQKKKTKAFSLVEVSVVIIIIGIFVAGIAVGNSMITKSRLQMAETLSKSSPIAGIRENVLWLETSLSSSIKDNEAVNDAAITTWNDQNNSGNKSVIQVVGLGPVYSNTINRVHAIKFDALSSSRPSDSNYLKINDASFLNNTDYTIVVLEKRQSSASNNYFLGANPSGTANQTLVLGYSGDSTVIHSQGSSSSYNATVSSYASSTDKPRIFLFTHSAIEGNKTYINGVLAAEDTAKTAHLNNISELFIGKGYTGEIGEIAIFTKALNSETRDEVTDYIAKKWSRPSNKKSIPTPNSCLDLMITDSGCDLSSAPCKNVSMVGVSSSMTAVNGSSVSQTCDVAGYAGTASFSCSAGVATTTSSCAVASNCNGISVTGVASSMSANHGATATSPCDAAGYEGTASFSCNNGVVTNISSCAPITCTITGVSGFNNKASLSYSAVAATIPTACADGFSGSPSYTCTTSGAATISGSCAPITCTITSVSGFNDKTNLPYSVTATPIPNTPTTACAAGFIGSPSYTCTNSGAATISGSCTPAPPSGCTGGSKSTVSGKTIHTFTAVGSTNFSCTTGGQVSYLIVAGGGGGGMKGGGGGGGGGVLQGNLDITTNANYAISVGGGGAGFVGDGAAGKNGENSSIGSSLIAFGGGYGGNSGAWWLATGSGKCGTFGSSGGSGGGSSGTNSSCSGSSYTSPVSGGVPAGSGVAGQGNNGAKKSSGGGGGGGAGAAAVDQSNIGGNGISSSISGTATFYGGGGGGTNSNSTVTFLGGSGGGGNGGSTTVACTTGQANTGGGGGAQANSSAGCAGGSGIVIISY